MLHAQRRTRFVIVRLVQAAVQGLNRLGTAHILLIRRATGVDRSELSQRGRGVMNRRVVDVRVGARLENGMK